MNFQGGGQNTNLVSVVGKQDSSGLMSPFNIFCLKWWDDGDLIPNDALIVVKQLPRVKQESEEAGKAILNY